MTPERIGPYRILGVFAEETFTITYRASDPGLGRSLVIRTARNAALAEAAEERLLREAKIMAPLTSDGVLSLYGIVRKDTAVHLLFEDIRGPRLSDLLGRVQRLSVANALAIVLGVAKTLATLHEQNLVHGGVHPDNIALFQEGRPVIIHFGHAHPAGTEDPGETDANRPVEYLAPEQILCEGTGPRADVFSLGVVLFELLTGARPWQETKGHTQTPRPAARLELPQQTIGYVAPSALAKLEDPLAPRNDDDEPRSALAHRIRNAVPPALITADGEASALVSRIVSRCLAKAPEDRYPDASALAQDLQDALREASAEAPETLVVRALAKGDYLPEPKPQNERGPIVWDKEQFHLSRLLKQLAVVFGLAVFGAVVTEISRSGDRPAPPPSETPVTGRGYIRVLAQPWAEVSIDGEKIDETPIARPIAVAPGRHFVTFAHPNAPDEKRTVSVVTGQTVLVDVAMQIELPKRDAGPPKETSDAAPPPPGR